MTDVDSSSDSTKVLPLPLWVLSYHISGCYLKGALSFPAFFNVDANRNGSTSRNTITLKECYSFSPFVACTIVADANTNGSTSRNTKVSQLLLREKRSLARSPEALLLWLIYPSLCPEYLIIGPKSYPEPFKGPEKMNKLY